MLKSEELRFAIEDSRARHEAIVSLIYSLDQQSVSLLGTYVTVGLATASAAISGLFTVPLAIAFGGATVALMTGAYMCFRALQTVVFNLPGRQAEFWSWYADEPTATADDAYRKYLSDLQEKHAMNDEVSLMNALFLRRARLCGLSAPVVALAAWLLTKLVTGF